MQRSEHNAFFLPFYGLHAFLSDPVRQAVGLLVAACPQLTQLSMLGSRQVTAAVAAQWEAARVGLRVVWGVA